MVTRTIEAARREGLERVAGKNRAEERRDAAARMRLLKVIALLLLAAVALFLF